MVVAVVDPAERDGELVAGLASHGARLGEPKMVSVRWASAAHETRLRCNEFEMALVANPARLTDR